MLQPSSKVSHSLSLATGNEIEDRRDATLWKAAQAYSQRGPCYASLSVAALEGLEMSRCDRGVRLVLGRLARQPTIVVCHGTSQTAVPRPQEHGWRIPGMEAPKESARDEEKNAVTTNLVIVE